MTCQRPTLSSSTTIFVTMAASMLLLLLGLQQQQAATAAAFVPVVVPHEHSRRTGLMFHDEARPAQPRISRTSATSSSSSSLHMMMDAGTAMEAAASAMMGNGMTLMIATVDSDIANIPTNEFAPIFMGGIFVMFGGVISALIVGAILESRNLYASVVADSYAQQSIDEEFWKTLSEEEKTKAQEMLQKIKDNNQGIKRTTTTTPTTVLESSSTNVRASTAENSSLPSAQSSPSAGTTSEKIQPPSSAKESKKVDMFSDYGA